ncbi:FHA domain-containing protein [Paraburkholderia bannensis]|uniref:FHA domain-containing protein n=1 Tax=Paraburkholderia bannensis TaxID=765414 RepID=UPI002AC3661C|nr:FHA domain-containing protein [Paraburkholderia bannensis]
MSDHPRLVVLNGLHAGANTTLSDDQPLKIGYAADCDLILADEGLAAHHVTIAVNGKSLLVQAASSGVTVFGSILKNGARTFVSHGAIFALCEVRLQFSNGEPVTDADEEHAERAWLLRHAPLAWLRKRLTALPRGLWFALAAMPLVLALAHGLHLLTQRLPPHSRTALLEQPAFRYVTARADKKAGQRVYEGYVQTVSELAALSLAASAQGSTPVLRVAVLDVMQEQLGDFLDKYYRGATLRAGKPGAFVAVPPSTDAYLTPQSWDYARVERLARAEIDGLQSLRFSGHEHDSGPVRIPLEALGLNLLSTRHSAWLADAQGTRYFAGARLPIGRIARIEKCGAEIIEDDNSVYVLTANHGATAERC